MTSEKRVVIADFSYTCKTFYNVRRYGLKTYSRPPEAGNMSENCPLVNEKSFACWSYGMLCFNVMTGKFIHKKDNKRESLEKDVYPLLFKSIHRSRN